MQFNSVEYFAFLALVLALYYIPSKTYGAQRALIVAASALFYAFWSAAFLVHFLTVVIVNFYGARLMVKQSTRPKKLLVLWIVVAIDLLNLSFFKYSGLIVDSINGLAGIAGAQPIFHHPSIILPLAISFYTFHLISYLVDIYHQEDHPHAQARSLLDFLFYVMLFPHQIAGPILRGEELFPQLGYQKWDFANNIRPGFERLLLGLFQKAVVADNLAIVADHGYRATASLSGPEAHVVVLAYSFQIFFDFAGYSNMGIGAARMMGYKLPENFDIPYISKNISEFWRRWHMTLSRWIRDYIFIPLGGSRGARWSTERNLLITMGLAGLWHGASWTFVVWGLYHGVGLVINRNFTDTKFAQAIRAPFPKWFSHGVAIFVTFYFVTFGWVLFRAPNFATAWTMYERLFDFSDWRLDQAYLFKGYGFTSMLVYGIGLAIVTYAPLRRFVVDSSIRRTLAYGLMMYLILVFAPLDTEPFIYFQF